MQRAVILTLSLSLLACQNTPRLPGSTGNNRPLVQDASPRDIGGASDSGAAGTDARAAGDADPAPDSGSVFVPDATPLDAFPLIDSGGSGGSDAAPAQDAGGPVTVARLLISEVATSQAEAEFVEVWNPSSSTVDLGDYYISDNSAYVSVTQGPWSPAGTPGTDFLVGFPPGATLGPDGVLVVAFHRNFEQQLGRCPDYLATGTAALNCGGQSVPLMRTPPNGSQSNEGQSLSNSREMVVLFRWDGADGSRVFDVDYVTWGASFDNNTRADKSSVAGYVADTPRSAQDPAPAPGPNTSVGRCSDVETQETSTGGNGVGGHDETSERLSASFSAQAAMSPGAKNPCIP